ncbi:MAG: response regulator [Thermodesulfobacteriota bacterium]
MEHSGKKKVLIVEDNFQNMVLVKEILTLHGYQTVEAASGTEAIKILTCEDGSVDIILMDLHLPQMDGVTATRIIKADPRIRNVPILALTASAMKGEEVDLLSLGFDGYVAKPIEVKKLVEAVSGEIGPGQEAGEGDRDGGDGEGG